MKIQVTQTLPNGQITQQILSKDGVEVLKIQAQPGAKLSFNVEATKPTDVQNTKAKTGNIKKVDNNLVLESEGEALVEVTDFYSTAGASVGNVGWNYAATDATVMSATPEAQALTSDAAVSESGALFPAIAPGWLVVGGAATVAAVVSGGSSSATTVASNIVSGVIVAGPVTGNHGLSVVLRNADGATLGTATVDELGKFSLDVGSYRGVIIAEVVDKGAGADYFDEASGLGVNLSAKLMAVGVMTGGALKLNINPLTSIAAQKAGLNADGTGSVATATDATEANAAVAKAFGLTDITQTDPNTTNDSVADTNAIGAVLAALSGLDAQNGSAQATIDYFVAGITQTGAVGVLTASRQTAALQGAAIADTAGKLGLVNKISDSMSTAVNTTGFSVGDVATDNIITTDDALTTTTTITGTVATGTLLADLDLKIGGVASANNAGFALVGTNWTYTLSAADVTALTTGTDGALAIELTVAGVTKGQRMVLKDMTDNAPSAVTFLNPVASILESAVNTDGTKLADINIADIDGYLGVAPTVSDAANFEVKRTISDKFELWLKSGVSIDYETVVGQALSTTVTAGGTTSQTFTLTIANANEAPTTVGIIADKTAVVSQVFTLDTSAYFADVDAGGLTGGVYSATGLGNGLSINASTGVISGTAQANAAAAPVVVKFTDAGGLAVSQAAFNLQAVSAPAVSDFTVVDGTGITTKGTSGDALTFAVTFSEAITVTGTLTAVFSVNGQSVTATYTGSGGTTLNFTGGAVPSTGDGTVISLTSLSGTALGNVSGQPMVAPTAAALTYAGYTVDNTAPAVTAAYSTSENAGTDTTPHTITLVGTDANGPVTFSGLSGTDAAKFSLSGNTLSFVGQTNYEAADDAGANHVYDVSVVATDAAGKSVTQAIAITVNNVNEAPTTVGIIADKTAVVSQVFTLDTSAYFADVDAGGLTGGVYSATGLGNGLSINASTGVISGTAQANAAAAPVVVKFTDAGGLAVSQAAFNLQAVSAPAVSDFTVVDGTGITTKGTSGDALTFAVTFSEAITVTGTLTAVFSVNGQSVTATYTGSGGTTLNFTGGAVPSTGDGTVISLTSLSGTALGNVSGQPMVAPTAAALTYAGYTVDNTAPAVTAAYSTSENAGTDTTPHTITLVGTDANGPVTFSGLSGTDAAKFSLSGNTLSFVGQTNYEAADDAGANHVYDVSVVATDAAGKSVTQAIAITVNNVNEAPTTVGIIADKTAVVSQVFTLDTSAYFADVDAGGLTGGVYSATGLGNGLSINASTGVISGTAQANAAAAPVVVKFTDAGGLAVSQAAFNLQAVSAPAVSDFTVVDGTGITTKGTSGDALTFAVTFSEAITVTGTLTAVFSVNGQSVTATYTGSGGTTLNFTGGAVPSTGDGTVISLTSLSGTALGNVSGQPMVAPTAAALTYAGYTVDNTAPAVTAAYSTSENAGTDTTPHTITLVGTDANGPVTFSGLSGTDAAKFSLSGNTLSFVGQTNYEAADDAGANHVYDVSVVATDAAGNAVTQAIAITVNNVNEAPVVAVPLIDQVAVLSQPFTYVVPTNAFTDVDAGTTFTYSATLANGAALSTATGWTGLTFNAATHTLTGTASDATTGDIDVRVTASDGTLSVYDDFHINAVSAPALNTTLGGVLNFDVRSNIVLTVGETVTKNSLGHIIITDLGGAGFSGESTTHTIDLNMAVAADAARVSIVGTGADTKIIINPEFDLDLSSNYSLSIDTGVFHGVTSGLDSVAFSTVNFSTVTPGTSTSTTAAGAVQAQGYFTDAFTNASYLPASVTSNTPTYGLYNTGKWVDMAGVGSVGAATALQVDASTGDYVFVWKDMKSQSTGNGEIALADTQIQLNKFGANDLVYIDNQENQSTAQADVVANGVTGGVGSAADPSWFAFEGVTLGTNIYIAVDSIHALPTYTDGQLANLTSNGWSNTGMVISA